MQSIEIDRRKRLGDEPGTGHNRFHPHIRPSLKWPRGKRWCSTPGMALTASLGLTPPKRTLRTFRGASIHPLTGPIYVKGAQPGDVLEVEFLDILPQAQAFSAIIPGFGFLRDVCNTPSLVHWHISDGWATSPLTPWRAYPRGAVYGHLCGGPFACATARLGSQGTGAD